MKVICSAVDGMVEFMKHRWENHGSEKTSPLNHVTIECSKCRRFLDINLILLELVELWS